MKYYTPGDSNQDLINLNAFCENFNLFFFLLNTLQREKLVKESFPL